MKTLRRLAPMGEDFCFDVGVRETRSWPGLRGSWPRRAQMKGLGLSPPDLGDPMLW